MPSILLIDSYDSYTYNIYQLLLDVLPNAEIVIVRNDQFDEHSIRELIVLFDFILVGPGPGDPCNDKDVGCLREVFKHNVPILGVCLGFQLLCLAFGGKTTRMNIVKHGQITTLQTKCGSIYRNSTEVQVTRYHSIAASFTESSPLEEIAWIEEPANGHVSMAAIHRDLPFVAVQYHPESACSQGGRDLVANFFEIAQAWNSKNRVLRDALPAHVRGRTIKPMPLYQNPCAEIEKSAEWKSLHVVMPAPRVASLLGVESAQRFVVLDSAASPSRYAVVVPVDTEDKTLLYKVGDRHLTYGGKRIATDDIWHNIAEIMARAKVENGPSNVPFWGGLVGYISYEAGLESVAVQSLPAITDVADINMVMATRSIVIDHQTGTMHVISIKAALEAVTSDSEWLISTCQIIQDAISTPPASPPEVVASKLVDVELPGHADYLGKIDQALANLAAGNSYELCLTAATKIRCCPPQKPWELYQRLRSHNPAPFACYMRLPGIHMLSSSPERFLSWSSDGLCQLRPIKGTVRKSGGMTREAAADLLRTPKEYAENLMIVDLIRHDLHQIAEDVRVPVLMEIEEYQTVYQLVSVIEGRVRQPYTGLDALSRALPPGSMTGAPKKRSVEILQGLERRRRGLYSGVCGYLSVGGGGDWSVIIRTAFRYDSENLDVNVPETWWIGAGGAITALSDPEAEWQEMRTKLDSTLPAFGNR